MKRLLYTLILNLTLTPFCISQNRVKQLLDDIDTVNVSRCYRLIEKLESNNCLDMLQHLSKFAPNCPCIVVKEQLDIPMVEIHECNIDPNDSNKLIVSPEVIDSFDVIPVWRIKFVNMEQFEMTEDLYDHIRIDRERPITLFGVDSRYNTKYWPQDSDDFCCSYFVFTNLFEQWLFRLFHNKSRPFCSVYLRNRHPDLLLTNTYIDGRFGGLFVKGDNIYVQDWPSKHLYELNHYIKSKFSLYEIRNLLGR